MLPPYCQWLFLIVLTLVDFGSSYRREEICYGDSYDVPIYYTPPLFSTSIYYKPKGGSKILAVSQGQSKHQRFLVRVGSIKLKDLTEQDDGTYLFFGDLDGVELEIKDCKEPQSSNYGDLFSWRVPSSAEYMEFSKVGSSGFAEKPQVIWNRTNPSFGRGAVKRNYYELHNLKQKDSGYYKFMRVGGELISWKRLKVTEYYRNLEHTEGEKLEIDYPVTFSTSYRILFTPKESGYETMIDDDNMNYRMELTDSYFSLIDLKYEDTGTYKFKDSDGFLVLRMELEVKPQEIPGWVYMAAFFVIAIFLICCCCCVKKCCCKKSSNKRNTPEAEAVAPPVFYHDTAPSTQPVVPLLSREPRVITPDPPTYNSVVGNLDLPPSTQQVTVPEGPGHTSTSLTLTSSDSDPRFEFKGAVFPSAPPLSSGTSIQDVYTSDKLNFL